MAAEAAVLMMKVKVDSAEAQRQITNIYKTAANIQKQAGAETVRTSRETTAQQIANDKRRQIAAAQVAAQVAKSETAIQKASYQTAKAQEATIKATVAAQRAATQSAKAKEAVTKQSDQSFKQVLKEIDGQIAAEKRLGNQTALTARAVGAEYDRMAKSADRSFDSIIKGYQKVSREAARASAGPSAGSQFLRGVRSTRFDLPGTNGALQPLIGATFAGGPAALAGSAAVAAGGFALGQFSDGIKLAADLEANLNVLQQATGASDKQLEQLRSTARELGADLTLPATSSNDAAKAMLELSKNGLKVDDVMAAAKGTLQLAAAASIDAADAAKYVAVQLNAFGLSGDHATQVADLLAAASKQSSASVHDLGLAGQQAASKYHEAGFTVQEMTADILQLAKAGIIGSDAGSSLRNAVTRLLSPTKEGSNELKRYGIQIYTASGQLLSHREIITNVTNGLKGLTQQQRAQAVQLIFGQDAQRAANIVLAKGTKLNDEIAKKIGETGAAAKAAGAQMKGFNGAMDGLNSALDSFKEKRAAPFLGALTDIVKDGSRVLDVLDGYIDRLNKVGEAGNQPVKENGLLAALRVLGDLTPERLAVRGGGLVIDKLDRDNKAAAYAATPKGQIAALTADANLLRNYRPGPGTASALVPVLRKYGVQSDYLSGPAKTTADIQAALDVIDGRMQALARQAPSPRPPAAVKKVNNAGGGGKPSLAPPTDAARASLDQLDKDSQFTDDLETFGEKGGAGRKRALQSLAEALRRDGITLAEEARRTSKGTPEEARDDYNEAVKQLDIKRRDRLKQIDAAEKRYADSAEKIADEARKKAEAEAKKTREDKEKAASTRADAKADAAKDRFDKAKERLGDATTEQAILAAVDAMGKASTDMYQSERAKIAAQYKKDYAADPAHHAAADAAHDVALEKAKREDADRGTEAGREAEKRRKAIQEKGAEQLKKLQELGEKSYKANADGYKEYLDAEEKSTELAVEKARSLEEEKLLIDRLVDIRRRQATLEYDLTMREAAKDAINDPVLLASRITSAIVGLHTGEIPGAPGAGLSVGSAIAGASGTAQLMNAARLKQQQAYLTIADAQRKAMDDAQDRFAIDLSSTPSYTAEESGPTHTFTDKYGIEHTVAGRAPSGRGRDFARAEEQSFQNGAASLLERGMTGGKIDSGVLKNVALDFGREFAGNASREIVKEIAGSELKKVFGDFLKGLSKSTGTLLEVGLGLQGLANILGAGGKKKQKNSIIGGVLGFALGSIIPGVGNIGGLAIGSGLGGFFADGGRPPLGRASWVGERGPELLVPSQPTVVLNQKQIAAVNAASGYGSGGGQVNNFYGDIHDRADADHIIGSIDRKRRREAQVA